MKSFGAQYVVYEDSGFLAESVLRIYPLVQKILFMVGMEPWYGQGDRRIPKETLRRILDMDDPEKKFLIVCRAWESEHQERNEGLRILRDNGCDWCLIVDDDEMYNRGDLWTMMGHISNAFYQNGRPSAFLARHLIYWRDRETVIDSLTGALPTFASTAPGDVVFTNARNYTVLGGVFNDINENSLICHHLSYVRDGGQMRRKFSFFSHSKDVHEEWIDRVFLAWTPEMEDLHPNPDNPSAFKRAVPVDSTPWRLENVPGRLRRSPSGY